MQSVKIPLTIDPYRAAAKKLDYQGIVAADGLERLASMVVSVADDAQVNLSFYEDLSGIVVFEGTVVCPVIMECQRCGEKMRLELKTGFRYSPDIKKIEELELQDQYDSADLNNLGEIDLYAIIEDELILSLPLIAKHSDEECPASDLIESLYDNEDTAELKHNPFAELGELIKHKNSNS